MLQSIESAGPGCRLVLEIQIPEYDTEELWNQMIHQVNHTSAHVHGVSLSPDSHETLILHVPDAQTINHLQLALICRLLSNQLKKRWMHMIGQVACLQTATLFFKRSPRTLSCDGASSIRH